jgi:ElaB/YqjD/DUF883 family membrane-anchored ribosome-binding protein
MDTSDTPNLGTGENTNLDPSETAHQLQEEGRRRLSEATDRLKEFQHRAGDVAKRAGQTTDQYVRENTWDAIGIAAALGCMVGFLLANSDRD